MIQLEIATAITCYLGTSSDPPDDEAHRLGERSTDKAPQPRVLIVEDEGLVAMNMESALAEDGFAIVGIVDNETDAIAAADRLKPDVILMDITLRDGDGISAARTILKTLETEIIFVSGNSDPQTLAAAQELRPAAFIRKPFVSDSLSRLVRSALLRGN
jgi:DNA-binding NarL/FixJ family response regulator